MPIELTIDGQLDHYRTEYAFHMMKADIPEHCRDGLIEYLVEGRSVGQFLTAIIENNLMEAVKRADDQNRFALWNYAFFIYNHAPVGSTGSKEHMAKWQEHHGLRGMLANAVASE